MFYSFVHPGCCNCPTCGTELDSWRDVTLTRFWGLWHAGSWWSPVQLVHCAQRCTTTDATQVRSGAARPQETCCSWYSSSFLWRHRDTSRYRSNTQNAVFITITRGKRSHSNNSCMSGGYIFGYNFLLRWGNKLNVDSARKQLFWKSCNDKVMNF